MTVENRVHAAQGDVLQSLRRDLRDVLIPDLASDNARALAGLMDEMLGWVAVALRDGAERTPAASGYDAATEMSASQAELEAAAAIAAVVGAGPDGDHVFDHVRSEAARLTTEMEAATALSGEIDRPLDRAVTASQLDTWLARNLPAAGRVEHLSPVIGGYSKDTWIIGLSGLAGDASEIILRRDLPFGPGENSVTEEYDILSRLADAGVAAPAPLAVEADPAVLGTPFLLFPRLPGKAIFADWNADEDEKKEIAFQVAACMAHFHTLDPAALGLPLRDGSSAVADLVATWKAKWQRRRLYPSAILEAAFAWLERNVPPMQGPARLVHGDVTFRNTLIDDGRLVALLDWEFHHPGDPVEDLSYFRLVAEPHVDWGEVIAAYEAAGGEPYDEDRAKFYEVWRSTRNAVTTATAWHGFVRGLYPASKAAYQGLSLHRFFLRDIAEKLEDVL